METDRSMPWTRYRTDTDQVYALPTSSPVEGAATMSGVFQRDTRVLEALEARVEAKLSLMAMRS